MRDQRGDPLFSDPGPQTPEGRRLWQLFRDGKLGPSPFGIRDFGQRVCQVEAEAVNEALDRLKAAMKGLPEDHCWSCTHPVKRNPAVSKVARLGVYATIEAARR